MEFDAAEWSRWQYKCAPSAINHCSIFRYFEQQVADHVEVLPIPRNECEPFSDRRRRDQGIESPQPVRFGVPLEQIVTRAPLSRPSMPHGAECPNEAVDGSSVPLIPRAHDQFVRGDDRNRDVFDRIDERGRRGASARHVDHPISIHQVAKHGGLDAGAIASRADCRAGRSGS